MESRNQQIDKYQISPGDYFEWVEKNGFVDRVVQRKDIQKEVGNLLSILLRKNSDIHLEKLNETSETNIQTREAS